MASTEEIVRGLLEQADRIAIGLSRESRNIANAPDLALEVNAASRDMQAARERCLAQLIRSAAPAPKGSAVMDLPLSRITVADVLVYDPSGRQVFVDGKLVDLSAKEFALLGVLAAEPTRVFSKETLMKSVWGEYGYGSSRTLDSHACRLRSKLAITDRRFVINVWGVGYRLIDGPVVS